MLQHSAFHMVQLSHPYMTTGKIIALTIQSAKWCYSFSYHIDSVDHGSSSLLQGVRPQLGIMAGWLDIWGMESPGGFFIHLSGSWLLPLARTPAHGQPVPVLDSKAQNGNWIMFLWSSLGSHMVSFLFDSFSQITHKGPSSFIKMSQCHRALKVALPPLKFTGSLPLHRSEEAQRVWRREKGRVWWQKVSSRRWGPRRLAKELSFLL